MEKPPEHLGAISEVGKPGLEAEHPATNIRTGKKLDCRDGLYVLEVVDGLHIYRGVLRENIPPQFR